MSADRFWFKKFNSEVIEESGDQLMVVPVDPVREDCGFPQFREALRENFKIDGMRFVYFVKNLDFGLFPNLGVATPEQFSRLATPEESLAVFNDDLITEIKTKTAWKYREAFSGKTREVNTEYLVGEITTLRELWRQGYYVMELY